MGIILNNFFNGNLDLNCVSRPIGSVHLPQITNNYMVYIYEAGQTTDNTPGHFHCTQR